MARDRRNTEPVLEERGAIRERDPYYAGREPAGDYVETGPREPRAERDAGSFWLWVLTAFVVGGLIGWGLTTWLLPEDSAGPEAGITLSELSSNPSEFYGNTVVVSGQIDEVIGAGGVLDGGITADMANQPGGFTMGGVLVVGSNLPELAQLQQNAELAQGDIVQVNGMVREFDATDIEQTFGFETGAFETFAAAGGPVIYADSIALVPQAGPQEQIGGVTAQDLVDNPDEFLTTVITLQSTPFERLSDSAFAFGDGNDILVVGQQAGMAADAPASGTGTVTGRVVEPSTAALMTALNLETEQELFATLGIDDESALQDYAVAIVARDFSAGGS